MLRNILVVSLGFAVCVGGAVAADREDDTNRPSRIASPCEGKVSKVLAKEGDFVQEGQLLISLEAGLVPADAKIKRAKRDACVADLAATLSTVQECSIRLATISRLVRMKASEPQDAQRAAGQILRFSLEGLWKARALAAAQADLYQSEAILESYWIRSPARGVIQRILVTSGNPVKEKESVILIRLAR